MSTSGSTGQAPACCARNLQQTVPDSARLCLGFPCIPSWRAQVQMAACLSGLVCRNQVQPGGAAGVRYWSLQPRMGTQQGLHYKLTVHLP